MSDGGIDLQSIYADSQSLLDAVLATHDIGMAGVIVNNTPFEWDRIDGLGLPQEPSVRNWKSLYMGRPLLGQSSNPVWTTAPAATISAAAAPSKKSNKKPASHFALGATTHLDSLLHQRGGFEVAVPYNCPTTNVDIIFFMALAQDTNEMFMSGAMAFNSDGPNFSVNGGDAALIDLIHDWMGNKPKLDSIKAQMAWSLNGTSATFDLPVNAYPGKHLHFETTAAKTISSFILTFVDD